MYNQFPFPQPYSSPNAPMSNQPQPMSSFISKQGVIRVHGRNGAEAFYMRPNEEVLLLDDTQPVVWHKQTDGAGYPTLNGYNYMPMKTQESIQEDKYESLEKRLTDLEGKVNAKSDPVQLADDEHKEVHKNGKSGK